MYIKKSHPNPWTEIWTIHLVGSSYRASDGTSRQSALRRAAKIQNDYDTLDTVSVDLARYEYEGDPAYHVYFDDREVGNIPADIAAELAKMEDSGYSVLGESCDIFGGPTDYDPGHKYGAEFTIIVRRYPTESEKRAEVLRLAQKAAQLQAEKENAAVEATSTNVQSAFVVDSSGFPRASGTSDSSPAPKRKLTKEEYDAATKVPRTVRKVALIIIAVLTAAYVLINYLIPDIIYSFS